MLWNICTKPKSTCPFSISTTKDRSIQNTQIHVRLFLKRIICVPARLQFTQHITVKHTRLSSKHTASRILKISKTVSSVIIGMYEFAAIWNTYINKIRITIALCSILSFCSLHSSVFWWVTNQSERRACLGWFPGLTPESTLFSTRAGFVVHVTSLASFMLNARKVQSPPLRCDA